MSAKKSTSAKKTRSKSVASPKDIEKLRELTSNLQELSHWQNIIIAEIARKIDKLAK